MNLPSRTILLFTLGVSAMFGFYWLCMRFIVLPQSQRHQWTNSRLSAVSLLVLYIPGLLLLWLFIKDLPVLPLPPAHIVPGDYLLIFLAQFFSVVLMALVTVMEDKAQGKALSTQEKKPQYQNMYDYVHLLVLVPLLEELLARGLLGARTAGVDVLGFYLLSALVFALIHLQTGRVAVVVGMFWNGLMWAWVYVAGGSFLVSALFHGAFNLLATCLPEYLEKRYSQQIMGLYMVSLFFLGVVGAGLLWFNRIRLLPMVDGEQLLKAAGAILSSPGTWVLIVACIVSYFMKKPRSVREKPAS